MSSLFLLSAREFSIKNTEQQGPQLHTRIPGVSLVLFYSKSCSFCQTLIPIFKNLPSKVNGVHFAMANISADGGRLQKMSEATQSKFTYVPLLVLYVNGVPYMEYKGPKTLENMAKFVFEVSQKLEKNQDFSFGRVCKNPNSNIPGYCAGQNEQDDDVCFLTYDEAYGNKPVGKSSDSYTYAEVYGGAKV